MPDEVASPTSPPIGDAREAPNDGPGEASPRPRRSDRQWSGLPVAASLALVAFAILFGIFGPRVVDRSNPPVGISAWELASAASDRHVTRVHQSAAEKPGELAEIEAEASSALGETASIPDLSALGFQPYGSRQISVPGSGRAVIVLYARTKGVEPTFVSLLLVPDREQYVVYSPFGKPTFLPADEVYPVDTSEGTSGGIEAYLWTDQKVVRVLLSSNGRALDEVCDTVLASAAKLSHEPGSAEPERR